MSQFINLWISTFISNILVHCIIAINFYIFNISAVFVLHRINLFYWVILFECSKLNAVYLLL